MSINNYHVVGTSSTKLFYSGWDDMGGDYPLDWYRDCYKFISTQEEDESALGTWNGMWMLVVV